MKKIIALLISTMIVIVCLSTWAVADEFSLRSGIKFAMSEQEVRTVEKGNGNNVNPEEVASNADESIKKLQYSGVSIAGLDNCTLSFFFSKDGKLQEVGYYLGPNGSAPPSGTYEVMKETLINKYGEPTINATGSMLDLVPYGLADNLLLYQLLGGSLNDLCQWLVEYDDCVVLIDLYNFGLKTLKPYVEYRMYTKEEVQSVINNKTEQLENQENARNNDL